MQQKKMSEFKIDKIRERQRSEHNEYRQNKRDTALNEKRLHLDDVANDFERITLDELTELALKVKKSCKDVSVLRRIKRAFADDDENRVNFVRVDGAVHGLVSLLSGIDGQVQLEAASCFVNLLASEDHKTVDSVAKKVTSYLILYLHGSSSPLKELCLLSLGNIAADCDKCCHLLKSHNFLQALTSFLNRLASEDDDQLLLSSALFSLRCYMRNKSQDWHDVVKLGLLKDLKHFLVHRDHHVALESSKIVFYLSTRMELDDDVLRATIDKMTSLIDQCQNDNLGLGHKQCQILTFLVRTVAGLCAESDEVVDVLIQNPDCDWRRIFGFLLSANYEHTLKESLWLMANMAGCNSEATTLLFRDEHLLTCVVSKLLGPPEIVQQALTCLCNLAYFGRCCQWMSATLSVDTITRLLSSSVPAVVVLTLVLTCSLVTTTSSSYAGVVEFVRSELIQGERSQELASAAAAFLDVYTRQADGQQNISNS